MWIRVECEHFENRRTLRTLGPCSGMDGRTDWQLLSMHEVNSWRSTVRRCLQWWNMLSVFVGGNRISDMLVYFESLRFLRIEMCWDFWKAWPTDLLSIPCLLYVKMFFIITWGMLQVFFWLDLRILQSISQIMMLKCLLYMIYQISFQMPWQTFSRNGSCYCESWILWSFDVRHSDTNSNSQRPIESKWRSSDCQFTFWETNLVRLP